MSFSLPSKGAGLYDRLAAAMKVLIIRTDRLGDTILASPVWQALKDARPEAQVTLLARRPYLPLFESDPQLNAVLSFPEEGRAAVDELARQLTSLRFDALLILYLDGEVARLVRKTSSPLKTGPLSRPWSWFLFTHSVRQKRSRASLHEADYNGLLLEKLGVAFQPRRPRIHLPAGKEEGEGELLRRLLGERAEDPFVVVHPGMGGSALNWPSKRYSALVNMLLSETEATVLVTGTDADRRYLGSLLTRTSPRLVSAVGKLGLLELALLLRRASVFVGPSTGPMHLATGLDTPVVTLFSPVTVHQARRWGPYYARGTVLTPPADCREKHRCRGRKCRHHDCMDLISVGEVLESVKEWLEKGS
jgi:ADP-heptose:LPS heptosyltransferase